MADSSDNKAINCNSLNGNPFPVNIEFSEKNGFYKIYLIPMSVLEILELIPLNTFLVFNVDANEYDGFKPLTLANLADKYSEYLKKFDEQTILMKKESIIRLLNETSHYNFCLIETKPEIDIDKAFQIIDLADKLDEITIIEETSSNLFLSLHDDCYLYLETNNKNLAFEVTALQIKTLDRTISDCSVNDLKFDSKELITSDNFSIVIPQNLTKTPEKISWKILDGTFKDFVYSNELIERDFELVFSEATKEIKIEKVRSLSASD